jgi:CHASE2 domain-containing sensor protein
MNRLKLKTALKFWQEIIFIIALGILIFGITMNIRVSFQHTINIVFYSIFLFLFICLIGQFYWKSFALSILLAVVLGLGSGYMTLAVLLDYRETYRIVENNIHATITIIFEFFLFLGLTATAISMLIKYSK